MRKNEQKYVGLVLFLGFIAAIATLGVLIIRGDFKVVVIETDATLQNDNVSEFVNLSDSQYGDEYFETAAQDQKAVVLFTSRWCGICNVLKTTLDNEFTKQAQEPVVLLEADVDINNQLAADLEVTEVPTVVFIDGERINKYPTLSLNEVEPRVAEFLGQ